MKRPTTRTILNTALIRERERFGRRELLILGAILFAVLLPFIIYIAEGVEVMQSGYRIEELKNLKVKLADENAALEIERAALLAPGRMERLARAKLKMIYPDASEVVHIDRISPEGEPPAITEGRP